MLSGYSHGDTEEGGRNEDHESTKVDETKEEGDGLSGERKKKSVKLAAEEAMELSGVERERRC